jgi:hypothetical protein
MMNGAHDVEIRHHAEMLRDHETRIRSVEGLIAKVIGAAAFGGVLSGILVQLVVGMMK